MRPTLGLFTALRTVSLCAEREVGGRQKDKTQHCQNSERNSRFSYNYKPIFHCKLGSRLVKRGFHETTKINKIDIQHGQPENFALCLFQGLALGFCIGGNANFMFLIGGNTNFSIFRYQHVGIPIAKLWCWGSKAHIPLRTAGKIWDKQHEI